MYTKFHSDNRTKYDCSAKNNTNYNKLLCSHR